MSKCTIQFNAFSLPWLTYSMLISEGYPLPMLKPYCFSHTHTLLLMWFHAGRTDASSFKSLIKPYLWSLWLGRLHDQLKHRWTIHPMDPWPVTDLVSPRHCPCLGVWKELLFAPGMSTFIPTGLRMAFPQQSIVMPCLSEGASPSVTKQVKKAPMQQN